MIYILDWALRQKDLEIECRSPLLIAMFLAIAERKNVIIKPEFVNNENWNVTITGEIYNFPGGEIKDGSVIEISGIRKIEHRIIPSDESLVHKIGRRKNKMVPLVTTVDEFTVALGKEGQELYKSANGVRLELMKSTSGHDPYDSREGERIYDFINFFEEINEDFKPLEPEEEDEE